MNLNDLLPDAPTPLSISPTSMNSLPPELLIYLISFLPRSFLPEIATICSLVRDAAEHQLWEEIDLTPRALISQLIEHFPFTSGRAVVRRDEHRKLARRHLQKIIAAGNKRPERWSAVTTINATTYRHANHHLVTLLHLVRETLTTLRVSAAPRAIEFARWGPHDGFYQKMADFKEVFPVLTTLELGPCHNVSYHHIIRLLALTPKLVTLKVTARDELSEEVPQDPVDEPWLGLPTLHHLKEVNLNFPEDDGLPDICDLIFQKAPNLERVTVSDIWADLEEDGWSDEEQGQSVAQFSYFDILRELPLLKYLDWRCGSLNVLAKEFIPGGFEGLQVLITDGCLAEEQLERVEGITILGIPSMERLIYRTRHQTPLYDIKTIPIPTPSGPDLVVVVPPRTLSQLSLAPRLSMIQFTRDVDLEFTKQTLPEKWMDAGIRGMVIRTYSNGNNQLVHLSTLTRSVLADDGSGMQRLSMEHHLEQEDISDMYRVGDVLPWEHAIALDGEAVSAELMDRAFGGAGGEDWRSRQVGRNMSLTASMWNVLLGKDGVERGF